MDPFTVFGLLFALVGLFKYPELRGGGREQLKKNMRYRRDEFELGRILAARTPSVAINRSISSRPNKEAPGYLVLGTQGMTTDRNTTSFGRPLVQAMPIWMENGWNFTSSGYVGKYKTPYGSWDGRAYYDHAKDELKFIIYNPPHAALSGSHGICFHKTEEPGAYWVHLNVPPTELFAGIQGIRKTLIESFER